MKALQAHSEGAARLAARGQTIRKNCAHKSLQALQAHSGGAAQLAVRSGKKGKRHAFEKRPTLPSEIMMVTWVGSSPADRGLTAHSMASAGRPCNIDDNDNDNHNDNDGAF